jgi:hypothetical protein
MTILPFVNIILLCLPTWESVLIWTVPRILILRNDAYKKPAVLFSQVSMLNQCLEGTPADAVAAHADSNHVAVRLRPFPAAFIQDAGTAVQIVFGHRDIAICEK